jgi:pyocin large subunit-like protein
VAWLELALAEWRSPEHLARHFRDHHHRLGARTIAAYDASARETMELGTYFEYRDLDSGDARIGYYDRETRRFTAMTGDGELILTHYRCSEAYVTNSLIGSTYA